MFEKDSPYAGKITAYDSPIYIADAALYLMNTQPDLGIKNPYALDQKQLDAAVEVLKTQRPQVSEYWSDYLKEQQSFTSGDTLIGTTWQFIANLVEADKVPVEVLFPSKGSTGWSDTWMVSAQSKNSNCAYAWMDYIAGPEANAQSAEYFGEAPANAKACDLTSDKSFCDTYHAADKAYADKIWYWTTPIKQCLDGRKDATCTDYGQWTTGLDRGQGLTMATSGLLHRRPGLRVGLLLAPPMLWLGVAYLGALAALFVTAFWGQNSFTGEVERTWTLDNFRDLFTIDVYRVDHPAHAGHRGAGDGAGRGDRVPGRALHGEGRLAARAAAAASSRC